MPREACDHGLVTHLFCTKSCCSKYLLNISPSDSILGGLDYHEPIDDSSGTDPSTMSCSYFQTIIIPAGSSAATGVVAIINEEIYEGDEDFFLDFSVAGDSETYGITEGSPRVFAGIPSEATVTILDRTAVEVYFDPDVYNVTEGQTANLILRLTRDVDPSVTIIVMVQTMDGSATGVYMKNAHYHPL